LPIQPKTPASTNPGGDHSAISRQPRRPAADGRYQNVCFLIGWKSAYSKIVDDPKWKKPR
jgi:hypothetical protein